MPAITPWLTDGPQTCDVVETVLGGQVVEYRTGSPNAMRPVGVAAVGSVAVAGVALIDAQPTQAAVVGAPIVAFGLPGSTTVTIEGIVPVTYAAAATHGQRLQAAAAGQVTPVTVATADARTVIAICVEAAGVAAGAVGRARLINCG